jgi:hypothetical protein
MVDCPDCEDLHSSGGAVDQLLRHQPEPRLCQLQDGLRQPLRALQPTCHELNIAADWLTCLAAALAPASSDSQAPARTGAQMRAEWQACLAPSSGSARPPRACGAWRPGHPSLSRAHAPGLFHTYDVPGLPRTTNGRESESRGLKRRLVSTADQYGAVKRLQLREGAWELITAPASLADTIAAISPVACPALREEERRVRSHTCPTCRATADRAGFRLPTRSASSRRLISCIWSDAERRSQQRAFTSEFCRNDFFSYQPRMLGHPGLGDLRQIALPLNHIAARKPDQPTASSDPERLWLHRRGAYRCLPGIVAGSQYQ